MANKLLFSKRHIEISCDRNDEATYELLTDFYPVHSNRIRTKFYLSIHKTPEVLKAFRGIDADNIAEAPDAIQAHYYAEILLRAHTEDLLANGMRGNPVVNERLTLDPHQQLGRELAMLHDKYGFFYDTRTGKTPLSLTIIHDSIQENPDIKWLVLCPLKLINLAWLPDIEKFFPGMRVINCHAPNREERLRRIATPANVYLMNTEAFIDYSDAFAAQGIKNMIVDESSDMKSNKSKISHALVETSKHIDRLYLLSGVPAPNGDHEYYMQLKALDEFCVPQSYAQYCSRYLVDISRSHQFHKFIINVEREQELRDVIKQHAIYIDQSVLDMPGRAFHEIELELPKPLKEYYTKMKNELYIELTSGNDTVTVLAPSIAAKLNKLNQITSGFVIDTDAIRSNKYMDTDKDEWHLLDPYRFDFLEQFLESEKCKDQQVIIWAFYRKEFEIIKQRLGDRCALVYGGMSNAAQEKSITDFMDGTVQYLIANPASADKGLTLTNAHIAIYFSLSYSYELFKQSAERIYGARRSQPCFCDYYIFLAKYTVDPVIYRDVLTGKARNSKAIMNHLKPSVIFP